MKLAWPLYAANVASDMVEGINKAREAYLTRGSQSQAGAIHSVQLQGSLETVCAQSLRTSWEVCRFCQRGTRSGIRRLFLFARGHAIFCKESLGGRHPFKSSFSSRPLL